MPTVGAGAFSLSRYCYFLGFFTLLLLLLILSPPLYVYCTSTPPPPPTCSGINQASVWGGGGKLESLPALMNGRL